VLCYVDRILDARDLVLRVLLVTAVQSFLVWGGNPPLPSFCFSLRAWEAVPAVAERESAETFGIGSRLGLCPAVASGCRST
jgi:hypothetical protein